MRSAPIWIGEKETGGSSADMRRAIRVVVQKPQRSAAIAERQCEFAAGKPVSRRVMLEGGRRRIAAIDARMWVT